jgi:hypothetical protein
MTGTVNYTYSYSVNGGPVISGDIFDCIGYTGMNTVTFYVDNGACVKEFTTSINCTGVGVAELSDYEIKLSPNPVNEMLTIELPIETVLRQIEILDIAGRQVFELESPEKGQHTLFLPVQQLNNGMYLLRFTTDNGQSILKRFVKL